MKRWLIIGASGQIGGALKRLLGDKAVGTYSTRRAAGLVHLDITDRESVRRALGELWPTHVVLAAGVSNPDDCERDPDWALRVNAEGAAHVAAAAKEIGAQLCFISSDHVFDGEGGPYPEDAKPGPVNLYGRSKLEGERAAAELAPGALIARTALVWSGDPAPARNALSTLLARARAGERVRVPADQWTTPTYAPHLAEGIGRLLAGGVSGIVHLAGPEVVARDEFARRALASWGLDPALVEAVPGAALQQAARRPQHAGLKSRIPMMPLDVCLQAAHG